LALLLAVSTENLKVLSLGRNNLKSLAGLEQVAETLEQLWISYCLIEKLKGVSVLKKVKVLYMSNNKVKDWKEFDQLKDMTSLVELTFMGNPLHEKHEAEGGGPHMTHHKLPGYPNTCCWCPVCACVPRAPGRVSGRLVSGTDG